MRMSTRLVAVIAFAAALLLPTSSADALGCTGCVLVVTSDSRYRACQDMNPGGRPCIASQSPCEQNCDCPGSSC